jgi:hypothetical protein
MYGYAAFFFFVLGGLEALLLRIQLTQANSEFLTAGAYNALFTMHGTTMIFLFVMPVGAAFMNYLLPLLIGARDVAFPRLNALSWWIFFFGGIFLYYSTFIFGTSLPRSAPTGPTSGNLAAGGGPGSLQLPGQHSPGRRVVRLPAQCRPSLLAGDGDGLLGPRTADPGSRLPGVGDQLHRHRVQHEGQGHASAADAGVRLDDHGRRLPPPLLLPIIAVALFMVTFDRQFGTLFFASVGRR